MAKFKAGDKVESVKSGNKGVVQEAYGEEKYAVLFDGATNPDRVEGFQIKAANGCAKNAKDAFGAEVKVGDTVKFATGAYRGLTGKVKKIDIRGGRLTDTATVSTHEHGDVEEALVKIKVVNSRAVRSANAVVQNAINACGTARNATETPFCNNYDVFMAIERGDRPVNDFIKYGIRGDDNEMVRGSEPLVRKDLIEIRLKKLISNARRRLANLEEGLAKLGGAK